MARTYSVRPASYLYGFDIVNEAEWDRFVAELPLKAKLVIDLGTKSFANTAQKVLERHTPVGHRMKVTGRTRETQRIIKRRPPFLASTVMERRSGGGAADFAIYAVVPYAKYVREGRGPIDAAPGHALRFVVMDEGVPRIQFATHVRGVPPNDYPARAEAELEPLMNAILGRIGDAIGAEWTGGLGTSWRPI